VKTRSTSAFVMTVRFGRCGRVQIGVRPHSTSTAVLGDRVAISGVVRLVHLVQLVRLASPQASRKTFVNGFGSRKLFDPQRAIGA